MHYASISLSAVTLNSEWHRKLEITGTLDKSNFYYCVVMLLKLLKISCKFYQL